MATATPCCGEPPEDLRGGVGVDEQRGLGELDDEARPGQPPFRELGGHAVGEGGVVHVVRRDVDGDGNVQSLRAPDHDLVQHLASTSRVTSRIAPVDSANGTNWPGMSRPRSRVVPADQRLGPGHRAGRDREAGLVVHLELAAADRAPQVGVEGESARSLRANSSR